MTTEFIVYLPPEVCGCLSVAQQHLDASKKYRWGYRHRWPTSSARKARHESKVQKLVAKAAWLLQARGLASEEL